MVSLDFELMWGVRDKRTIADYGRNILGVRQAIPALLDVFASRDIACTWATVGFLFCENKDELMASLPERQPRYTDARLSPYSDLASLGHDEDDDPYHFGLSLLRQVQNTPRQEIGTHTFAHFYCLEEGSDPASFRADLVAAQVVGRRRGIVLCSIAFPRNQIAPIYLRLCCELGLTAFRGNERIWFHEARPDRGQTKVMRAFRLADSYLPLAGALARQPERVEGMVDIASSRFLRPTRDSRALEKLRLRRITAAMTAAAQRDEVFHLWWHPHNFGVETERNIGFLAAVLDQFGDLNRRYGMRSMTMGELAAEAGDDAKANSAHH